MLSLFFPGLVEDLEPEAETPDKVRENEIFALFRTHISDSSARGSDVCGLEQA